MRGIYLVSKQPKLWRKNEKSIKISGTRKNEVKYRTWQPHGKQEKHELHTNYDDLMRTTISHKVFLIMYSDLRRV